MKKRVLYAFAIVLLAISVALVVWQGSFRLQQFDPSSPGQTFIFSATSILVFVLMVTLAWVLARTGIKLYVERHANREGSRIKTKLVVGALALSMMPVFFLVLFSYQVLNINLKAWFTKPVEDQNRIFSEIGSHLDKAMQDETAVEAALLAALPETREVIASGVGSPGFLERFCRQFGLNSAAIYPASGGPPLQSWGPYGEAYEEERTTAARYPVQSAGNTIGHVAVTATIPMDLRQNRKLIKKQSDDLATLLANRKSVRSKYLMLMALITLFVLSASTWIALFLAKQISVPIAALLEAAHEVRQGNLKYRVEIRAGDELGKLVRSFNQMTHELETSSRELDLRQRFTEAILESIPTGVISIGSDGAIRRVNRALAKILPAEQIPRATRLEELFSRDDTAELKYLMKRARRTGSASREMELRRGERTLQVAVTVCALEERLTSGFVVVLEDTTDLLRAQKAAAWHEVARRVAHEIKNPLTPIALSAERITRQLDRLELPPGAARIVHECAGTISRSVESVKTLVDEFSRFARFPAAQPARADLNEVVRCALAVFEGRLEGIQIRTSFSPGLPAVNLDREQFQRAVVNLVDNAAEAMQDSLVKNLYIATQPGGPEVVELVIADTGCGIGQEEKEKLFLPYFSTKKRGTGLGLAIVSHIIAEHGAQIRVEDNQPVGARFTVEIPALFDPETVDRAAALKV